MQEYSLFKGLVLRYLCYFRIYFCWFISYWTRCGILQILFSDLCPNNHIKNFNPTKDIRSVLSNLRKRIVVKIELCIIYLKYRFVFNRKISRVAAVPSVKKNGKINENVHEKHTLQRDVFLKTVYRVSVRVNCYIFSWDTSFNAIALIT